MTREPALHCQWPTTDWPEPRCGKPATWQAVYARGDTMLVCDAHLEDASADYPGHVEVAPLIRDALAVSIVAASFHGTIAGEAGALLDQWLAGDEAARGPLEDLAHQLEALGGRGAWPMEPRERVEPHGTGDNPHVWLPVALAFSRGNEDWQCTCGVYRSEHRPLTGHRADMFIIDDPHQCTEDGCTFEDGHAGPHWTPCHDRACQREAGHAPPHMARSWNAQNGLEEIGEWTDEDRVAEANEERALVENDASRFLF